MTPTTDGSPEPGLFGAVVGQTAAIAALRAAAAHPVHAYLLVGPPGTGKSAAATAFAAALLCPNGGDGTCDTCRRVLAGVHPDLVTVERQGAALSIDSAREITRLSLRSPVEGDRKVLVLTDFHLVREAGPALLKTIEEPPPSTIFIILAEYLPPELVTIASRCVRIEFRSLTSAEIVGALEADGVPAGLAAELAALSDGRLDRARLLATDPGALSRREAWRSVPTRLDGSGARAALLADELVGLLEASVAPLRERQAEELAALEASNARMNEINGKVPRRGAGKPGMKELEERHKREIRRQRTDELRAGLAALAGVYRDRLVDTAANPGAALEAIALIQKLNADLANNPGELLQLQALLARLGRLGIQTASRTPG